MLFNDVGIYVNYFEMLFNDFEMFFNELSSSLIKFVRSETLSERRPLK